MDQQWPKYRAGFTALEQWCPSPSNSVLETILRFYGSIVGLVKVSVYGSLSQETRDTDGLTRAMH